MPPPPRRSSNLYLPSKTWPIRRSTGASTKVSSARNGIKSSGHTCVLSGNRRPHLGHESITRCFGEHHHYRLNSRVSVSEQSQTKFLSRTYLDSRTKGRMMRDGS